LKEKDNNNAAGFEAQKDFWENAGEVGYGKAIFANSVVEKHIILKQWSGAIDTASRLGVGGESNILELGCGDGAFANSMLAERFAHVDAYDGSTKAIESAKSKARSDNISFNVKDLIHFEYDEGQSWDAAFMIGFLHHVKPHTPEIVARLSKVASKVIVVEPNGNNLIRKALELQPSYKSAGEDSFKLQKLREIFESNGYELVVNRCIILIPSMLPASILSLMKRVEVVVEASPFLSKLCSTYILGFEKK
jgi:hypothetical protein